MTGQEYRIERDSMGEVKVILDPWRMTQPGIPELE